jgi:hypothetical protein
MTFCEETYTETLREQYELDSLDYMIPDTDEVQGEFKLDEGVDQTERASASQDEEAEP